MTKVGIIAAMDPEGIIAVNGSIPWHYKSDLRRFKQVTMDSAVVFGAKTYETLPGRLAGRTVLVVSRNTHMNWKLAQWPDGVYGSLSAAIYSGKVHTKTGTVWIGGGGEIYQLALSGGDVDFIDLTIVPPIEIPPDSQITRFPVDLLENWALVEEKPNAEDTRLIQRVYHRL